MSSKTNDIASGRMAFLLLLPFQFMFGLIYAWGSLAPVIHARTGWSDAVLDLAFSVTPLVLSPSVLMGGYLAGRFEPRNVLAGALVCFVGGGALGCCSASPMLFIIGYGCIALGLGAGLSTPACVALIGRAVLKSRGLWSGALLAVYGSSAIVSAPLFYVLAEHLHWQLALGILCGCYAMLGIIALCKIPTAPEPRHDVTATPSARLSAWSWRSARAILVNTLLLVATVPLGSMIFGAIGRLALSAGFSASLSMTAVTLMALANGAGRFAGGWLSDVTSAPTARAVMLACAAAGYCVLLVSQHWHGTTLLFWMLPALVGFSFGGLAGKLPALAAYTSMTRATEVFSIYFGVFALSSFGGPFLSATLGFPMAVALCGGLTITGFAVALLLAGSAHAAKWNSLARAKEHLR